MTFNYSCSSTQINRLGAPHPRAMEVEEAAILVHYQNRMSEVRLNFTGNVAHHDKEVVSLALSLQAALNLATPPVGLRLRVVQGTEAVVCPLRLLVTCPAYIATTFQGKCDPLADSFHASVKRLLSIVVVGVRACPCWCHYR